MAKPVVRLMDDYMLDKKIVPNITLYEAVLLPGMRRQFAWDESHTSELRALCQGVRDRLGADGFRSRKLGRRLKLADCLAANTLADWFGMLCSTFSVWRTLTSDEQTLTARNLDFPATGGMDRAQFVLIYRGA
ncbi:MAG: hypothetical protein ABIG44_16800 [Planctomycetota bacterium]